MSDTQSRPISLIDNQGKICEINDKGEIMFFKDGKPLTAEEAKEFFIFLLYDTPPSIFDLANKQGYNVFRLTPEEK